MNRIFIIVVFVFSFMSMKGQYHYSKFNYYSLGLSFGPDMYSYSFDAAKNITNDDKFNYTIGLSGAYFATWIFEVHASLNYSSRNMTLLWDYPEDPNAIAKSEYKLNYLNIPIELRVNALYLNWMKLNLGVGIMPDFRFKPKEILTYQDGNTQESIKFWGTKNFAPFLFAFPFSANLRFYLNRHYTIGFGASYYLYVNKMHTNYLTSPANAVTIRAGLYYDW